MTATDLARVLSLAPDLQLVLLQACHTGAVAVSADARDAGQAATASVALALIRAGVPLVIAMQGEVAQPSSRCLCARLLRDAGAGRMPGPRGCGLVGSRCARRVAWSIELAGDLSGSNLPGRYAWLARLTDGFEISWYRG